MDYQAELCNLCSVPWQLIFNLHCPVCFLLKQQSKSGTVLVEQCQGSWHERRAGDKWGWDGSKAAKVLCSSVSHCLHNWDTQPQAHICSFFPTEIPVTIATNFCMVTFSQGCLEKQFIFIHYHHTKLYKYSDKRKMHSANICILLLNHNLI